MLRHSGRSPPPPLAVHRHHPAHPQSPPDSSLSDARNHLTPLVRLHRGITSRWFAMPQHLPSHFITVLCLSSEKICHCCRPASPDYSVQF
uniref:Uncharacterized protein n=1 Tax=Triticum urartu TaxID=4572 RepID=A0A8R7PQY8_TRIUA